MNTTILELKAALTKPQKWKSPVIDKVPNFFLIALSPSHVTFTSLLNEIMQNPEKTPEWMCDMLSKNNGTKDLKNYWLTTCLSTTYKLLTSVLIDRTYLHLEQNDLFPLEQNDLDVVRMVAKTNLWSIKWYLRPVRKANEIWVVHGLITKNLLIMSLINGSKIFTTI